MNNIIPRHRVPYNFDQSKSIVSSLYHLRTEPEIRRSRYLEIIVVFKQLQQPFQLVHSCRHEGRANCARVAHLLHESVGFSASIESFENADVAFWTKEAEFVLQLVDRRGFVADLLIDLQKIWDAKRWAH